MLLSAAAAGALILAGCGTDAAAGDQSASDGEAHSHDDGTHPHGDDVTLEHVHGLGIDPADDTLYAGTHYGLVRISPDGELTRIADRVQDFMGFTVVGPEHYLASGHPGAGQDGPGNLGLIETTDGGQTWETLSLAGDADFHALDAADGVIYGYSGGRLLVSEDGVDWADRGEMRIADLAADPTDPQRVLATTEAGLVLSEDAGKNFTAVPDAPLLVLADFAPDGDSTVGVAPDGTVYGSTDGGLTWAERGTVDGAPEALTVDGDEVYVAVGGAVLASTDGGATFTELYRGR
ncbi:F510_1955 family glycosylhydrolase [Blastococcus capsensis]|uniref:F510_1955 family glycosylhydrolase n=1 Tax=Blastococcus capsensis TaxID=1564163 RepID=UPI00253F94D6|nr:exo-alpha-sialidase [Blastococcus capsensis]MDK3256637.1 exo-alpha-sialidase [Blastococcus capsensis]